MTPEDIEYVREWAASGNEPRMVDRIPWVVMYRCCAPVRIGGGLWALSESGLTIAAQAERVRYLEERVRDFERQVHNLTVKIHGGLPR